MPSDSTTGLTRVELQVLLALLDGPLHGHAVKLEIRRRSAGRVDLGPGTLYGALRRLEQRGFIAEAPAPTEPDNAREEKRRYLAVTQHGVAAALDEVDSVRQLLSFARAKLRSAGLGGTT